MITKMLFAALLLFGLSAINGYASEKKKEPNCTVVIAADLHFDMPPKPTSIITCLPSTRLARECDWTA